MDQISNIGNLILVGDKLNSEELGDKSFKAKKPLLVRAAEVWKDDVLRQAKAWGGTKIEARASLLANVALEEVWTI